ncbi:PP2C family protein-serine/threonine phosphatase [Kitasatospora purpeofusca]|uniref:PP2C family protein-serine/threonine phosphatase n=1 Tax=Kitasatospora purpeofusca TaxID=67352 RepID=UPI0036655EDE
MTGPGTPTDSAPSPGRTPSNWTVAVAVLAATVVLLAAQAASGSSARLVLLLVFVPALLAGLGTLTQTVAAAVWVTGVIVVSSLVFPPPSVAGRALTLVSVVLAEVIGVLLCARRLRRDRELFRMRQTAVTLQRQILRPLPAPTRHALLDGRYRPVEEDALVGGDLYDIADTPYGTRVLVGDVQGKGLPAIGAGFAVLSAFREAAFRDPALTGVALALENAVTRHNAYAAQGGEDERFVTATVFGLDGGSTVQAVNCGHLAPYLLGGGEPGAVPLDAGVPLGLAELAGLTGPAGEARAAQCFELAEGATLLLVTDGVTEAADAEGVFYPIDRRLRELSARSPDALAGAVEEDVRRYSHGPLRDDLTILTLRRTPGSDRPAGPREARPDGL